MVINKVKIKICGMKLTQNINSISLLNPDFIGFIFYPDSPRDIGNPLHIETFTKIKKVGVFVKNSIENILQKVQKYALDFVQLHGDESIEFCEQLYKNNVSIIKVFRINEDFSFSCIQKYINYSVYFLFETHCLEYGGSGRKFSWEKISEYSFETPFFLSGGIGTKDVESIKKIIHPKFFGVDLNSKFEIEPGNKNRDELRRFIHKISL